MAKAELAEKQVQAGRLEVRVNQADPSTAVGQQYCQICGDGGLSGASAE